MLSKSLVIFGVNWFKYVKNPCNLQQYVILGKAVINWLNSLNWSLDEPLHAAWIHYKQTS